jgi:hypothetical protein
MAVMQDMRRIVAIAAIGLVGLGGCAYTISDFEQALPATLEEVTRISEDTDLTGQQKRDALEQLGFPPLIIDVLLIEERTANQSGGDLRSAWEKVSDERFDELTPDEVQLYADAANEVDQRLPFDLTDEAAQAIVDLFEEHNIATQDDLQAFLDDPNSEIPSSIPNNALQDVFIDFDPSQLVDSLP